jgi:hypothetical protein
VTGVMIIKDVRDKHHKSVAEIRDSDNFVKHLKLLQQSRGDKMNYKDYARSTGASILSRELYMRQQLKGHRCAIGQQSRFLLGSSQDRCPCREVLWA